MALGSNLPWPPPPRGKAALKASMADPGTQMKLQEAQLFFSTVKLQSSGAARKPCPQVLLGGQVVP